MLGTDGEATVDGTYKAFMVKRKHTISLKDIAKKAGVSPSLVSFVLNGKQQLHRINPEVAERVKRIAKELDYKPNSHAKSLRDGVSRTIGVVVPDISNQFFSKIVQYIESFTEDSNYMALFASSEEKADKLSDLVDRLLAKGVDGLILVPCEGSEDCIQSLVGKDIPMVLIDRYLPEIRTNYVCLNNESASYNATKHLITQGFSRIGFIGYDINLSHMKSRINGYKQAMSDYNLSKEIMVKYVSGTSQQKGCERALRSLIEGGADAVVFATNTIAVNSLYHIQKEGIRIPEDLGVVGFDSDVAFDFFYSPLTCIRQPLEQMAQKAVSILLDQLSSQTSILQQVEVEGELVVRRSSRRENDN